MKISFLKYSKTTSTLLLTGFLSVLTTHAADAPPAASQPDRPARGPGGGPGNTQDRRGPAGGGGGLGLDDKQRELYREASQKSADELRKLDEKLRAAQKELVQAAIAEKYDEKAVREKAEALAKIQVEITTLRAKAFSAVAPTLKAEQREQLETSRVAAAMLTGGGFGGGPGGPGGNGFRGPGGDNGPGNPNRPQGDQPRRRQPAQ